MELLNWVRLGRKINIFYWSQTMQFLGMLQSYYMRYIFAFQTLHIRDIVSSFLGIWWFFPRYHSRLSGVLCHSLVSPPTLLLPSLSSIILPSSPSFLFSSHPHPTKSRNKYFLSTCLGIMIWAKVWTLLPDAQVWILTPQSLVVTLYRSLSLSMPQFSHFQNKNYMIYITELLLRLNKLRDLRCL